MVKERLKKVFPSWQNALLALVAAGLLILAFPDFEWWWTAWFALVPLMWAVEREKASVWRAFLLGWLFGTAFFFGTCWWLTYAPIHYAAMPWPLAYFLIFIVCLAAGIFPGIFAAILAVLLRRFGTWAFLSAPFVWVSTEFARYWITGNNWNAIAYSQAFPRSDSVLFALALSTELINSLARLGGALLTTFIILVLNSLVAHLLIARTLRALVTTFSVVLGLFVVLSLSFLADGRRSGSPSAVGSVIAIQPNVPMAGLDSQKWNQLRQNQIDDAEREIKAINDLEAQDKLFLTRNHIVQTRAVPKVVILPESPMNFAYEDDPEFRRYIGDFAVRNNVSVLFNSSQPDKTNGKYFNSALMIGPDRKAAAQYDKIYLLPFGEAVPPPFAGLVPAFVGSFSYGSEYDLLPLGDAKAGVMICFESHFGELGRRYVQNGADAIIEMTNDGYLGPTPVLRQHLANAVFRAVETNRPVLRVTNVGITAYIDERGTIHDELPPYTEGTRVWSVSKSDGSQTFYVRYGDWFAWLCVVVTVGMMIFSLRRRREIAEARA